ncbi:sirohydrochlorin chelatase [Arthrobacter sp. A5]|uniref:sirohydrochlorin chelatase n=1 Tax=Arthrobacter sp. A5 TaxID=576926 RepID=UPI003DA85D62
MIACAHGTRDPAGQACIDAVRAEIGALRPELTVLEAYVDVQEPALPEVVSALPAGTRAVVVPLLLSVGFHVRVDIARAVAGDPGLTAAEPLGPDPRLALLLHERLQELKPDGVPQDGGVAQGLGVPQDWGVVLASAGSSEPAAAVSVGVVAAGLRHLRGNRILAGYGAGAHPSVPDAVAQLRAKGHERVAVASYLLAPGFFHDQLAEAGADLVSAPLLPAGVGTIARIALERFDRAVRQ